MGAGAARADQQQQQQGLVGDGELGWQQDDRALKMVVGYAQQNSSYRASYSYQAHSALYWTVFHNENDNASGMEPENVRKAYGAGVVCCSNGEQLPCILLEWAPGAA